MKLKKYLLFTFVLFTSFIFINKISALDDSSFENMTPEEIKQAIINDWEKNNGRVPTEDEIKEQVENIANGTPEEKQDYIDNKATTYPSHGIPNQNNNTGTENVSQNQNTNAGSSASGSGGKGSGTAWCEQFNQVWYVFGIIIQIIYVVTPLLLIVTGSITMIQAMMKKDESEIKKAQNLLVKKIIVAVIVFLMVSITKMVIGLVADEGWTTCANCAFNPSQGNCGIEKVPTG